MFFPNNWSLTAIVLAELEKMILHAIAGRLRACFVVSSSHNAGADNITSTTSVVPFDQEELAKMLDLTDRLKG
jgi:hypothetical protein